MAVVSTRVFCCVVGVFLLLLSTITSSAQEARPPLAERQHYQFPFQDYDAFSHFMLANKESGWTESVLHAAFSRDLFDNCRQRRDVFLDQVSYPGHGGMVKGWVAGPQEILSSTEDDQEQLRLLIVYHRGGAAHWGRMVFYEKLVMCHMANLGYVMVASDFRGDPEISDPLQGEDDLGLGDAQDSLKLIEWVKTQHPVDDRRLALWGFSRGTMINSIMLTKLPAVRLVINHGSVVNVVDNERRNEFDQHVYPLLVPGYAKLTRQQQDSLLKQVSPYELINHFPDPSSDAVEFLFLHGADDWRTRVQPAQDWAASLERRGYPVTFITYSAGSHTLSHHFAEVLKAVSMRLAEVIPVR
ncbi:MAG: hypothetical protein Tsb002_32900 [Wenzhouxiangellaceae bacterium]